jgi:hypothetical protein
MKQLRFVLALVCLCVGASILSSHRVSALSAPVYGITVSPAIKQINLESGQSTSTYNILITNNTSSTVTLYISAQNFTALNQTGGVGLLGPSAPSEAHGLSEWLKINDPILTLAPKASQSVPITIYNAQDIAPGGHYAALLVAVEPPSSRSFGNQFSAHQVVSSLVFLTTAGHISYSVKLEPLQLPSITFNLPTSVNIVLDNTGNTQTAPRGLITLSGPRGEIARGIINIGSGLILPNTSRIYTVKLLGEHKIVLPGIYTFHISYQANTISAAKLASVSFLYIDATMVIILVVLLLVVLTYVIHRLKRHRKV